MLEQRLASQVVVGQGQVIEQQTSVSMCRQLQQSASLSDDELEYAAAGTASPPSEAAFGSSAEAAQPGLEQTAEALSAGGASPTPLPPSYYIVLSQT